MANLVRTLATGYILFFFSERLFWAVWRPGDTGLEIVITWLAYSAITYLTLAVVAWSRADDFWSVFLAGAIYGWLVEGGLTDTLYGTQPSAPFPMSISLTGLAWHALLSVVVGWWAVGRALRASSAWPLAAIASSIAVFWGLWAMLWRQETPPISPAISSFFVNAAVLTLGLMVAWWTLLRCRWPEFRPGWLGSTLCVAAVAVFYSQHVMKLGWLPIVVLPVLVGVALVGLACHRQGATRQFQNESTNFPPASRWLILASIPFVATATYGLAVHYGLDRLPIATACYAVGGPSGFVLFVVAWCICVWRSRRSTRGDAE